MLFNGPHKRETLTYKEKEEQIMKIKITGLKADMTTRPDFDLTCECGYSVCSTCGYPCYPMELQPDEKGYAVCQNCGMGNMVQVELKV